MSALYHKHVGTHGKEDSTEGGKWLPAERDAANV